jgi:hypothetical protein
VNPSLQELSKCPTNTIWKELDETDPLLGAGLAARYHTDEVLSDDSTETEQSIQELLSLVTNVGWKYPGLCLYYSDLEPISFFGDDIAPLQRELEEWWDNPGVTPLTEEEFRARFA